MTPAEYSWDHELPPPPVAAPVDDCCCSAASEASAVFFALPDISSGGDEDDLELHAPIDPQNILDVMRNARLQNRYVANVSLTQRTVLCIAEGGK